MSEAKIQARILKYLRSLGSADGLADHVEARGDRPLGRRGEGAGDRADLGPYRRACGAAGDPAGAVAAAGRIEEGRAGVRLPIERVMVNGAWQVVDGEHVDQAGMRKDYARVLKRLGAGR